MANVSQLQPALVPQVQTTSSEPAEKDADFLALRLLNKRARVKLSPGPIDLSALPGKACLFAIANSKGWFAAIIQDTSSESSLILSPLADLRSALESAISDDDLPFQPQRRVPLRSSRPTYVTFALNDSRLLLGLLDGSIVVYGTERLFSRGDGSTDPLHMFPPSSTTMLVSIQPNPADIPELVAVLRDCNQSPGSLAVELLDVEKLVSVGGWMAGKSPSTTPTSISWSPKGKQLALGLQNGDIVTYSPSATATPKSSIPHPPAADRMSAICIQWLSTASFHAVYAPPGQLAPDSEQHHFHVFLDSKNSTAQDIKFNSPYLPFPGLRPPGAFMVCLRSWDPSRVLLFIGDSTSSDIGLIGSVANDTSESWHNLSLEEASMPSLPLDKDQNDTVMLGLDLDVTNTSTYQYSTPSGESLELPSPPIMYAYASDGTILGWYLLNTTGRAYPGMNSIPRTVSAPSDISRELSSDMNATSTELPSVSTVAAPASTQVVSPVSDRPPAFSAQASNLGQPSVFNQSAFNQQRTLAFGQSSFGQTTGTSGFVQTGTSAFGSTTHPLGGFGAFSSAVPPQFGRPMSGFGTPAMQAAPTPSPSAETPQEESMVADDGPSLGGLGLGAANSDENDSRPSIFGNTSVQAASTQQSSGGGLIKPGTGFGAFANLDQKSLFANPPSSVSPVSFSTYALQTKGDGSTTQSPFGASAQPSPGFSQSAVVQTTPTFGQSGFGKPAFGQPTLGQAQAGPSVFGKSSFGVTSVAPSVSNAPSTAGSAFTAFASTTQSAFAAATPRDGSEKPVWATGSSSKSPASKSVFGGASTTSVFGEPAGQISPKTLSPFAPSVETSRLGQATSSVLTARESLVRGDESRSPSPVAVEQEELAAPSTPITNSTLVLTNESSTDSDLKTGPTASYKPAAGFFGEMPKDSPFLQKQTETRLVSAFSSAITASPPASTPVTVTPVFGARSMPGATFKSAFGISPTPTHSASPPMSAFNAFSSTAGGGFGAFAGNNKSFTELLRTTGDTRKDTTDVKAPVSTSSHKSEPQQPPSTSQLAAPDRLLKPEQESKPLPMAETTPKAEGEAAQPARAMELSLESISSSTSSSFIEVAVEEGEVVEEGTLVEGELGDDTQSFLSDIPSESESEEESETLSEVGESAQPEPADIPLPTTPSATSRSPSMTPKAELPRFAVPTSPPPPRVASPSGSATRVSPIRELTTTPPGSPVTEVARVTPPVASPVPKPSPPATSLFNLAPRSANRPVRSSPLASTPLVGEVEPITPNAPPQTSKSAPPTTLQPAVPKEPFGQWTAPVTVKNEEAEPDLSSRPKTPPLLSTLSTPPTKVSGPSVSSVSMPALPLPPFTPPSGVPSQTFGSGAFNFSSKPVKSVEITPPPAKGPPQSVDQRPSPMVLPSPAPSAAPSPSPSISTSVVSSPLPVSPSPEQGMQAECLHLLQTLNRELENLKSLAADASQKTSEMKKTSGVFHYKSDLGHTGKWAVGDVKEYGRILTDMQADVKALKEQRVELRKSLRELDSNMLKAGTRKEEIVRFNRAKTDAGFAKMLKVRTLGPEYLEIQSQLRRDIRAMRESVQKLEDHLQASKKRLNEFKTGKPSLRAPSLDTVSRTFRNIDIAIDQQRREMNKLRARMSKLEVASLDGASVPDKRLSGSTLRRPSNVTPNVAATTAAALNAERSAQKLKRALLAVRTEPLLNTKASEAHALTSFQTPQKTPAPTAAPETPGGPLSLPTTPSFRLPSSIAAWSPPTPSEFGDSTSFGISPSRGRGGSKHHQKPVALKKTPISATAAANEFAPPADFSWKPLQPMKPISTLPFSITAKGSN